MAVSVTNLIPANIELSAIEVSLVNAMSRELIIKSMMDFLTDIRYNNPNDY